MIKIVSLTLETLWIKPVWTHRVPLWALRSFQRNYLRSYKTKKKHLRIKSLTSSPKTSKTTLKINNPKLTPLLGRIFKNWKHQSDFRTVLSTHNKPKKEHLIIHENTSNANQFLKRCKHEKLPKLGWRSRSNQQKHWRQSAWAPWGEALFSCEQPCCCVCVSAACTKLLLTTPLRVMRVLVLRYLLFGVSEEF